MLINYRLWLASLLAVSPLAACGTEDPCASLDCGEFGYCNDTAVCSCDPGHAGDSCEIDERDAFVGSLALTGSYTCPQSTGGDVPAGETVLVSHSNESNYTNSDQIELHLSGSPTTFIANVAGDTFDVIGDTDFGNSLEYEGTGIATATGFTFQLVEDDTTSSDDDCVYDYVATIP